MKIEKRLVVNLCCAAVLLAVLGWTFYLHRQREAAPQPEPLPPVAEPDGEGDPE